MITEGVGKLLVTTQDELKLLKNELETLQNPFNGGTSYEYRDMLNKIKDQLSQFEEKIHDKINYLVTNELDSEATLNKLPLISKPDNNTSISAPRSVQKLPSQYRREISDRKSDKLDPQFLFGNQNRAGGEPIAEVAKKLFQDNKHGASSSVEPQIRMKPYSTLKPITSKLKSSIKMSRTINGIPKENPATIPAISEKEARQGLLSLIHKGLVPREVDLTPVFERGAPTLASQKIALHHHKKQFEKGEISSVPAYLSSIKFDVKAFEPPQPDQNQAKTGNPRRPSDSKNILVRNGQASLGYNSIRKEAPVVVSKATNPKDYEEVLDTYSLHQFIIRKGKTLVETPEFQSYKRTYFGSWDYIQQLIQILEQILAEHDVRVAYIDGKKLVKLAETSMGKPTMPELLECIVNQDDIQKVIKIPQNMYKGLNGKDKAATKIQSYWRMYKVRKTYRRVKVLVQKVNILQTNMRLFLQHKKTQEIIKQKKEQGYERYRELAKKFQEDWPLIKYRKRVEIHIQSISHDELQRLSMEKFMQKENAQIAKLFALKDPLVDIIYVAPFDLPPEVLSYYAKVFELGGLDGYQNRYTILWPENHNTFPGHFPTSRVLLYSPKTIKRIKQLIHGKTAYLVPSMPSSDDIDLAVLLDIPLFSGDPQKNALYSTKSGAKSIFNACDMPLPPGSFNIYDEKEFILTLTKLIAYNFHINQWIFKIDDEFSGRGHASFHVNKVKALTELRNLKLPVNEELVLKVHEIVSSVLPNKIKIVMPHLYRNYNEYIQKFVQKGGVIEAAPNCLASEVSPCSIGFVIDPVGEVQVLGTYDKFVAHESVTCGFLFPQKSVPNINLQVICETLGKALYAQGVFGYTTLDMVSFPESTSKRYEKKKEANKNFWVIDLKCYMTNAVASTLFFDFLMKGRLDEVSGMYTIPNPALEASEMEILNSQQRQIAGQDNEPNREKRCFMYCPFIFHAGLSSIQYKTFFHSCRMKGISYDLESKTGTTFILLDSLQTGILGVITIGRYRRDVVKFMNDALNFLVTMTGQVEYKPSVISGELRPDTMHLTDVSSKIRMINRAYEKKQKKIVSDSLSTAFISPN